MKMKKTIIALAFVLLAGFATAQNVTKDAAGNYIAVKHSAADPGKAKSTGKTFTDQKGTVYPVYVSERGKLFVIRTSAKTGNSYKMYLKEN